MKKITNRVYKNNKRKNATRKKNKNTKNTKNTKKKFIQKEKKKSKKGGHGTDEDSEDDEEDDTGFASGEGCHLCIGERKNDSIKCFDCYNVIHHFCIECSVANVEYSKKNGSESICNYCRQPLLEENYKKIVNKLIQKVIDGEASIELTHLLPVGGELKKKNNKQISSVLERLVNQENITAGSLTDFINQSFPHTDEYQPYADFTDDEIAEILEENIPVAILVPTMRERIFDIVALTFSTIGVVVVGGILYDILTGNTQHYRHGGNNEKQEKNQNQGIYYLIIELPRGIHLNKKNQELFKKLYKKLNAMSDEEIESLKYNMKITDSEKILQSLKKGKISNKSNARIESKKQYL
jgi:hypothetical protein